MWQGLAFLILGGLCGLAWMAWLVDQYGQVDRKQHADVIIVLGARVLPDGRPGPDLYSRTRHGVNLYQSGWASQLMFTGGYAGDAASAAAVARRLALKWGVPDEHIWLADGSMSTWEDAKVAARLMRRQGWQRAIVVSHPLHLYRAQWMFRRAGLTVYPSPTPDVSVAEMDWRQRLYLDVREALALAWSYLPGEAQRLAWTAELQKMVVRFR
ncbi:MAG: YdcF family protein [Anaerolineae bacterium]|nr:YdcF family protein [Anaerolineae bacterium]MDW8100877.1 YdcF family protein [Anaerolineae bacterium]